MAIPWGQRGGSNGYSNGFQLQDLDLAFEIVIVSLDSGLRLCNRLVSVVQLVIKLDSIVRLVNRYGSTELLLPGT